MPANLNAVVHTVFGAALSVLLTSSPLMQMTQWFDVRRPLTAFLAIVLVGLLAEISSNRVVHRQKWLRWWTGIAVAVGGMFLTFSETSLEPSGKLSMLPDINVAQITSLMLLWAVLITSLAWLSRLTRII
jgi:hypothetical protein